MNWFLKVNGKMACEAKEAKGLDVACAHPTLSLAARDGNRIVQKNASAKIEILQLDECPAMKRTESAKA